MQGMRQHIIFISGMGRSGTSVLDLMIGAHPKYVGVGEAFGLIEPNSKRLADAEGVHCSCGQIATECSFWGEAVHRLRKSDETTASGRYGVFLDVFKEHYGPDRIPVDSSKSITALKALTGTPRVDVKVIYMIRDVRGWTVSLRQQQGQNFKYLPSYQRFLRNIPGRLFWRWYLANKRNQEDIQKLGTAWLQLSYEELCLYPVSSLAKISGFLNEQFTEKVFAFNNAEHHGVLINSMRNDERKMSGLFYDSRWFFNQRQWQLPMVLFPNIMKYNNHEVYRHIDSPFN